MAYSMTPKQAQVKAFLIDYQARNSGLSPSYDEIAEGVGITSKSGVHRLIEGLQERGHIRKLANRARALMVIDDDVATARNRAGNVGDDE